MLWARICPCSIPLLWNWRPKIVQLHSSHVEILSSEKGSHRTSKTPSQFSTAGGGRRAFHHNLGFYSNELQKTRRKTQMLAFQMPFSCLSFRTAATKILGWKYMYLRISHIFWLKMVAKIQRSIRRNWWNWSRLIATYMVE